MTRREFFEMVITNLENEEMVLDNAKSEEMVNFAKAEINKMDIRNANRTKTPSKKAVENEPIKEKIAEFLTEKEPTLASEIAHGLELKVQKVSALCRQMVENGILTVTEVKVKNKGKQKAYTLA